MRAILIDPFERTITEVNYSGKYEEIYTLIDCSIFDVARIDDHGGGIYIDDEGLIRDKEQAFFAHSAYPQPLAGKGLLLGCDMQTGDTIGTEYTVEDVRKNLLWCIPVRTLAGVRFIGTEA